MPVLGWETDTRLDRRPVLDTGPGFSSAAAAEIVDERHDEITQAIARGKLVKK
jgi:hypothetical protein